MILSLGCKINIGLYVTDKRPDGFHNLQSLFYPLTALSDVVELIPSGGSGVAFSSSGLAVDCDDSDNLCVKAYKAFATQYPVGGVRVHLHKLVPFGAGLGGGSADAAAVILLLNKVFEVGLTPEQLAGVALNVGSDVPFFVYNRPLMVSGRGEIFSETDFSLAGTHITLVKPDYGVSTKEAYAGLHPAFPDERLEEILKRPSSEWKSVLRNDFEQSVCNARMLEIKEQLYNAGAFYVSLTGSGSAIYALSTAPLNTTPFTHEFVFQTKLD